MVLHGDYLPAGGVPVRLITGLDAQVADWVATLQPHPVQSWGLFTAMGVARDDKIIAGVVYNHKEGRSIMATIAATDPNFCRKGVLRALFSYPFIQLDCSRITCLISDRNDRSIKLCKGLGFVYEGKIREHYSRRENLLVYGMLRRECRWLEAKHDKQEPIAA